MTPEEHIAKLKAKLAVLYDVQKEYSNRTIDNIIQNLEACLDFWLKKQSNEKYSGKITKNYDATNKIIKNALCEWSNVTLTADADEWAFHLNYDPEDVLNATLIFQHVLQNFGIKHGVINEANAASFGHRLHDFIQSMTGLDTIEIVKDKEQRMKSYDKN